MLYRVWGNIIFEDGERLKRGQMTSLKGRSPARIAILLERKAISEVQSPPLRVLPKWEKKADVLEMHGIVTVVDLVTANLEELSAKLDVPVDALERVVASARGWIEEELS